MNLKKALGLAFIMVVFVVGAGRAEFYRYKDANGVLRFTDNLAEVPFDQRPKVHQYNDVEDSLTEEEKAAKKVKKEEKAALRRQKREAYSRSGVPGSPDQAYNALKKQETALEKEGRQLQAQQESLTKMRDRASNATEVNKVNERIAALNKRIADYERKRQQLMKRIDHYNKMIDKADSEQ